MLTEEVMEDLVGKETGSPVATLLEWFVDRSFELGVAMDVE